MTYRITIKTDNSAFADEPGQEVSRILESVAHLCRLNGGPMDTDLRDINGNLVGEARITTR